MTENIFERYRKIGAVLVEFATSNQVIQTLEGDVHCLVGDAILTGVMGERWPVSRYYFDEVYEPAGVFYHGKNGQYRKKSSSITMAKQMATSFKVQFENGDILNGNPGDWLTQYSDGKQGVVADNIFCLTYQRI
jgi:hypothetical protein